MSHGFTKSEVAKYQHAIVRSSLLVYQHRAAIHYSQGPHRWDGILFNYRAYQDRFPTELDCSAMSTWQQFDALKRWINDGLPDIINGGRSWRDGGFTGTMIEHGRSVSLRNLHPGTAIIYGNKRTGETEHVATSIGGSRALSHGSEAAPFIVDIHYRDDILDAREYVYV